VLRHRIIPSFEAEAENKTSTTCSNKSSTSSPSLKAAPERPMLTPAEIFAKTRRIGDPHIEGSLTSFRRTVPLDVQGRGVEFSDVREYVPGDDIRSIHWEHNGAPGRSVQSNAFTEERELTILIAVDVSAPRASARARGSNRSVAAATGSAAGIRGAQEQRQGRLDAFLRQDREFIPPRNPRATLLRLVRTCWVRSQIAQDRYQCRTDHT